MQADPLLVLNGGSSSIKVAVYPALPEEAPSLLRGVVEGIGAEPRLHLQAADSSVLEDRRFPPDGFGHHAATECLLTVACHHLGGREPWPLAIASCMAGTATRRRSAWTRRGWRRCPRWSRSRCCTSRTTWPRSAVWPRSRSGFRRWPATTRPSTAPSRR